jgi:hypothetical protein
MQPRDLPRRGRLPGVISKISSAPPHVTSESTSMPRERENGALFVDEP